MCSNFNWFKCIFSIYICCSSLHILSFSNKYSYSRQCNPFFIFYNPFYSNLHTHANPHIGVILAANLYVTYPTHKVYNPEV